MLYMVLGSDRANINHPEAQVECIYCGNDPAEAQAAVDETDYEWTNTVRNPRGHIRPSTQSAQHRDEETARVTAEEKKKAAKRKAAKPNNPTVENRQLKAQLKKQKAAAEKATAALEKELAELRAFKDQADATKPETTVPAAAGPVTPTQPELITSGPAAAGPAKNKESKTK